jgi:hypothetical protein
MESAFVGSTDPCKAMTVLLLPLVVATNSLRGHHHDHHDDGPRPLLIEEKFQRRLKLSTDKMKDLGDSSDCDCDVE